ncbi:uncharacterized protein LOC115563768 [Drosophila navojoa]|uniref:uncharacterized protein LOC115563768 n=1 Tax=Drosophila navojoa TaxID=7232 RepID=UPI0011BFAFA4|nr:uncharacterized protein LOC115563768 [Drosophila navojoa]XP_030243109.1 uncharacterized protein LOC115563768 [Drosophila navojoa]XP_030243110.1 uncharacterized protein LOC115563768 [Drosophila navojoa]
MAAPSMSLLSLDDDCLANIFKYLVLDELMELLGKVHPRIDYAIERQLHRFRIFEFSMRFPPKYETDQLRTLGKYIKYININVGYSIHQEDALAILRPLCMGAKESGRINALKIQHANITIEYMDVIRLVAPLLLKLDLRCCDVEDSDQFSLLLDSAIKLKILALNYKDVIGLGSMLLSRLSILKVNWVAGTFVHQFNQPSFSISKSYYMPG